MVCASMSTFMFMYSLVFFSIEFSTEMAKSSPKPLEAMELKMATNYRINSLSLWL